MKMQSEPPQHLGKLIGEFDIPEITQETSGESSKVQSPVRRTASTLPLPQMPAKPHIATTSPAMVITKDALDHEKTVPVAQASRPLYRLKGFWLFDIIPDELIIEEERIIVIHRYFPFGQTTDTFPISKLAIFEVNTGLIFASIRVADGIIGKIDTRINWLFHQDAFKAKAIVDGLRLQDSQKIVIQEDQPEKLIAALETLGGTK